MIRFARDVLGALLVVVVMNPWQTTTVLAAVLGAL